MCPSKAAADSTAGFLGHHWMSKHHWALVGSSYRTWQQPRLRRKDISIKHFILIFGSTIVYKTLTHLKIFSNFQVFHNSKKPDSIIFPKHLPPLYWDSSKESCCLSHSSIAALDLLRSMLWTEHLYTHTKQIKIIKTLRKYGCLMRNSLNVRLPSVVLQHFQRRGGKAQVPHLDDGHSVILRGQNQLSGHLWVPGQTRAMHLDHNKHFIIITSWLNEICLMHKLVANSN